MANTILDHTGSPAYLWLHCLQYVCFILSNTYADTLRHSTPLQVLTSSTNDISPLLFFHWYQPVYYKLDDLDFPSDSCEHHGHCIGVAKHVGHAMTYLVLSDDTNKIIFHSNIHTACDPESLNLHQHPLNDSSLAPVIQSHHDSPSSTLGNGEPPSAPILLLMLMTLLDKPSSCLYKKMDNDFMLTLSMQLMIKKQNLENLLIA